MAMGSGCRWRWTLDVVVDGVRYVPADQASGRVGVGITTHNRSEVFAKSLAEMRKHLPPGAKLVVVDDGSKVPVEDATYRFETAQGIARAKNKCLELLDDCEHIFLWDDDGYPLCAGWERPYIESPEPHLMYQFPGPRQADIHVVAEDDNHIAWSGSRGVLLYVHRSVLDVAGGMDPGFGRWGYEHPDWSNRIHAFGLTTWRFADVKGSCELIYSADEHVAVDRSVDSTTRQNNLKPNLQRSRGQANSAIRYEYREVRDVIVTPLLTTQPDHSRGNKKWDANTKVLDTLRKSVVGQNFVVLHDELDNPVNDGVTFCKVPNYGLVPYFQRWVSAYQWLRDNPNVGRVWFVDGADVTMLRPPWDGMQPGMLYVGDEPCTLNKQWMLDNHPAEWLQEFMTTNGHLPLLNAGLLGGERDIVLSFLHAIVRVVWDTKTAEGDTKSLGVGDMALFNWVAHTKFSDVIFHGPQVNTTFKAYTATDWSWWQHK